ncbi:hypothetical protein ABZ543_13370 [Streptomyces roseifaciens]
MNTQHYTRKPYTDDEPSLGVWTFLFDKPLGEDGSDEYAIVADGQTQQEAEMRARAGFEDQFGANAPSEEDEPYYGRDYGCSDFHWGRLVSTGFGTLPANLKICGRSWVDLRGLDTYEGQILPSQWALLERVQIYPTEIKNRYLVALRNGNDRRVIFNLTHQPERKDAPYYLTTAEGPFREIYYGNVPTANYVRWHALDKAKAATPDDLRCHTGVLANPVLLNSDPR